jgi:hypothetical protein
MIGFSGVSSGRAGAKLFEQAAQALIERNPSGLGVVGDADR